MTQSSAVVQTDVHERFMHAAIERAIDAERDDALPIGAVLVKNSEIIADGVSLVWKNSDPSAHAEMECLRNGCMKLGTFGLTDCVLYSTLEPCCMCLCCASWSQLSTLVYGAHQSDVSPANHYELDNYDAATVAANAHRPTNNPFTVVEGVLRQECAQLLTNYKGWEKT
ncbi:MAG: nucleoside deaminase [Gammaproteobacteria bacterium]|nr:nucleoside deaminase [Gammaproteobacteria bacterium]